MDTQFKKQQCSVVGLTIGWLAYAAGIAYFTYQHEWPVAALWIVGMPALRWTLYHSFPRISSFLGYGPIADKIPSTSVWQRSSQADSVAVNFYSFFSCPFCPIVLARLQALQEQMGFTLRIIDVTLKPQTLIAKGIMSVPVVEVGNRRLVGNSTTDQLAALIAQSGSRSTQG